MTDINVEATNIDFVTDISGRRQAIIWTNAGILLIELSEQTLMKF